jgi:zinc protease
VALAARQLAQPAYPDAVWQRERSRWAASLREAETRPGTQASRAFAQAVYGPHPYGASPTEASLARIDIADLRRFHANMVLPCRARVTLVGAVRRNEADALVRQLLAGLPQARPGSAGCPALPPVPEVQALSAPADIRLPFAAAQAQVFLGQPGISRSDPDFFALLVGNHILGGGGFGSRLTREVRETRGLSYSVFSGFSPGRHAGAFTVGLQTRPDQAQQALDVARDTLARFVAEGPTAQELQAAKDNLVGGFPLRLDSNRKLLDNVANIAWNDLPLDYLATWTQRIEALTVAEVRTAMQRALQPGRMVSVILGPAP